MAAPAADGPSLPPCPPVHLRHSGVSTLAQEMGYYERHFSLEARIAECTRLRLRRPHTIPVVAEGANTDPQLHFFALPHAASVVDLLATLREQADLPVRQPLALTVGGYTPASNTTVSDLYAACVREDGFLHVTYRVERRLGRGMMRGGSPPAGSCFSAPRNSNGHRASHYAESAAVTPPVIKTTAFATPPSPFVPMEHGGHDAVGLPPPSPLSDCHHRHHDDDDDDHCTTTDKEERGRPPSQGRTPTTPLGGQPE